MTIAEFAEELRVRPVTVRSWITKGKVRATRSGQRKWLIRRSELGRMLKDNGQTAIASPPPPQPAAPLPIAWEHHDEALPPEILEADARLAEKEMREHLEHEYSFAIYEWGIALERSEMAPPDARFPSRIRQIARAASAYAANLAECANEADFVWTPLRDTIGMTLSAELRPEANRPGPQDGWARFDRIVTRLGDAMAGDSPSAVVDALRDLRTAMTDLAEAIEKRPAWRPPPDDEP